MRLRAGGRSCPGARAHDSCLWLPPCKPSLQTPLLARESGDPRTWSTRVLPASHTDSSVATVIGRNLFAFSGFKNLTSCRGIWQKWSQFPEERCAVYL